jgi:hypothetical protein
LHASEYAAAAVTCGLRPATRDLLLGAEQSVQPCAGAPLLLVLWVLHGKGAEHVRQLLLKSPSFERGLMLMVDTWQVVLHDDCVVSVCCWASASPACWHLTGT